MNCPTDIVRLFFALIPPVEVRRELSQRQRQMNLQARPVAEDLFHITLVFLGEVERLRLPAVLSIGSGFSLTGCTLLLDRLGCFEKARVAWLGPFKPTAELVSFQERLVSALAAKGFSPDEKPWKPHVTLYRDLRKPCSTMRVKPVGWRVESFSLVQSTLTKAGPVYRVLDEWAARD